MTQAEIRSRPLNLVSHPLAQKLLYFTFEHTAQHSIRLTLDSLSIEIFLVEKKKKKKKEFGLVKTFAEFSLFHTKSLYLVMEDNIIWWKNLDLSASSVT